MKNIKRIISISLTILLLALIAFYIYSNWGKFSEISLVNGWLLLLTIPPMILSIYSSGVINELAIEPHGVKVGRKELFGLASITRFVNQFMPSYLGASLRALYFKKKYDVSYAKFSSSFVVTNIMQLVISGFIAIALYFLINNSAASPVQLILLLTAIFFFLILLVLPMGLMSSILSKLSGRFKNKPLERLHAASEAFVRVKSYPGVLIKTSFWILVMVASSSMTIYSIYLSLGLNIDIASVIFIAALSGWGLVLSITPAGIGVREGIIIFAAQIVGAPVAISLVMAFILRFIRTLVAFLLSLYFAPKVFGRSIFKILRIRK